MVVEVSNNDRHNRKEGEMTGADFAAEALRDSVRRGLFNFGGADAIQTVLDDRDRLLAEVAELRRQQAQQAQPDPAGKATERRLVEMGRDLVALLERLDRVARQQITDSDDHEERLVALERLHPGAVTA